MSNPQLHFPSERVNKQESRINEETQKEDAIILTYEHYDICEVI